MPQEYSLRLHIDDAETFVGSYGPSNIQIQKAGAVCSLISHECLPASDLDR
jgi:hypothetical protein